MDSGENAQPKEHPLDALERVQVALGETDADTFFLRALHRTIRIENSAQETLVKFRRGLFDFLVQLFVPGSHAEFRRKPPDGLPRNRREFTTQRCGGVEERGIQELCFSAPLRRIDADSLDPLIRRFLSEQQAQQISFSKAVPAFPAVHLPVIVQEKHVAEPHVRHVDPPCLDSVPRHSPDQLHWVVASGFQHEPFFGRDLVDSLDAGGEKAFFGRVPRLAVHQYLESVPDEVPHLLWPLRRHHKSIFGNTGIGSLHLMKLRRRAGRPLVHPIQEDHAGVAGGPRCFHDPVKNLAGVHPADDLTTLVTAAIRRGPPRLCPQRVLLPFLDCFHEFIGGPDGDVEIGNSAFKLALDEFQDVRVIRPQDAHVRATPAAPLFDSLCCGVEHTHERNRPAGLPAAGHDVASFWPEPGERKPCAAAGLVYYRSVLDCLEYARNGILHRQDIACRVLKSAIRSGVHQRG